MTVVRGLILTLFVFASGCYTIPEEPAPEPEPEPIVVEAEQKPFPEPPPPPPPEPQRPLQTDTGKQRISVASERTAEEAAQWVQKAGKLGYRAEVETVTLEGVIWHRVVLPGYASREDAEKALGFADKDFGVEGTWRVGKPGAKPAPAPPAEEKKEAEESPPDSDGG